MNEFLKKKLQVLADEYETKSFYKDDPSKFLCQNKCAADTELLSFIAAMLSFGNRKQFIPKIQFIKNLSEKKGGSYKWISSKAFMEDFPCGKEKFYRFYSFDDMQDFFMELWKIITSQEKLSSQKERPGTKNEYSQKDALSEKAAISAKDALSEKVTSQDKVLPSTEIALEPSLPKSQNFLPLGNFFQKRTRENPHTHLCDLISEAFPKSKIVPKGKNSAKKRINMFLRWMVRTPSQVDIGLWAWYDKSKLIIPLDVHVLKEAINLKLLPPDSKATRKTAETLTQILDEVFPKDPVRADFALFALGVNKNKQ